MMTRGPHVLLWLLVGIGSVIGAQTRGTLELPVRISGAVISGGGVGNPTGTTRVEIFLARESTSAERTRLLEALKQGQRTLLETMYEVRSVGTVRFGTQLAHDLRYARQTPAEDGGTHLLLATDRPVSAWELWEMPRYADYPFTLIELELTADGRGSGAMILAAQVRADPTGRFIHVENFASQPIRLTNLEVTKER